MEFLLLVHGTLKPFKQFLGNDTAELNLSYQPVTTAKPSEKSLSSAEALPSGSSRQVCFGKELTFFIPKQPCSDVLGEGFIQGNSEKLSLSASL